MIDDPKPDPSASDLERAWVRQRPRPTSARGLAYVRFVYGLQRVNWRFAKVFMVLWLLGVGAITLSAAADVVGHLGWGYHPRDVLGGMLMMAFGCTAIPFFVLVHALVTEATRAIYGPEPAPKAKAGTDVR